MNQQKAKIVLEDGTCFDGYSFGAPGERCGEMVFNTSMSGYQEILTDPSYTGQMVTMTYPLIGNYGITGADKESQRIYCEGLVVRECSRIVSNWRAEESLAAYLQKQKIIGIEGVDTRALTKRLRVHGAMKAIMSTEDHNEKRLREKVMAAPSIVGIDLVKEVTCTKPYSWNTDTEGTVRPQGRYHVVVLDCGVKQNILRLLVEAGCKVTVVPARTTSTAIRAYNPDGVLLSNGPGDPAAVSYVVTAIKELLGVVPLFGICLGHQMLGLALGGKTYKLKFGHHGGNHPVQDCRSGTIAISAQNHCFCIDPAMLDLKTVAVTHINLNDQTIEGIEHRHHPAAAVQFHPEASPGPHDARYLFSQFVQMMQRTQ